MGNINKLQERAVEIREEYAETDKKQWPSWKVELKKIKKYNKKSQELMQLKRKKYVE